MNSRGEVRKLTLDSLNAIFRDEYPGPSESKKREQLIRDFIELHDGDGPVVIKNVSDIPGYDRVPLDPDIAEAVRAPFSFGNLVSVVYTYTRVGGVIRRYRFEFERGNMFRGAECTVIGRGIGNAVYYE